MGDEKLTKEEIAANKKAREEEKNRPLTGRAALVKSIRRNSDKYETPKDHPDPAPITDADLEEVNAGQKEAKRRLYHG